MASSGSIKGAQAIKLCDLCEEDNIKWRCIECDKFICEKCRTIHLRVPVTAKHQIVTIATPIQDVQRKVIIDNIMCNKHVNKMMCLFCKICDQLVCRDCVSSDHSKHQFVSIESVLEEKLGQLRNIGGKIDDKIIFCESKSKEIGNQLAKFNSIFDEAISKIKLREEELKDAIHVYSKVLQDKVEGERSKLTRIISKIEQKIDKGKRKLEDQKNEVETALTTTNGDSLFKATRKMADLDIRSPPVDIKNYVPSSYSMKTIPELFGELFGTFQKMTFIALNQEVEFKVLKTFTTNLSSISHVVTVDDSVGYISQSGLLNDNVVRKVSIKDNQLVTLQQISAQTEDMALIFIGYLLLSLKNSSTLKVLETSGIISTLPYLHVKSGYTTGIHVLKDNDLIVGVIDSSKSLSSPYICTGELQVYNKDRTLIKTFKYDGNKKLIFTSPERITTNINNNIIVIDRTSGTTGRVVTLDKHGSLRWVYEGSPVINAVKQFNPLGIVTTSQGHIIVLDVDTNVFHVLSEEGDLISYTDMSEVGIQSPRSFDIDKKGQLRVGCGGGKLHIVKLQ